MLYEDLRAYGGTESAADARIRGKYAAEMAYFAVLEQIISRYAPRDARNIHYYNNDLLGAARDEMAKHASDAGLVRYTPGGEGLVDGFTDGNGQATRDLRGDSLRALVRDCFTHSEALYNIVSTHICSVPPYRGREMTDEEIKAAADAEFERILDESDPASPFSRALDAASRATGDGNGAEDEYAPVLPVHRVNEAGDRVVVTEDTVRGLKISPLLPELRTLRQSGYFAKELGLTAHQGDLRDEDDLANNNPVLTYDPDKKLLYNPRLTTITERFFQSGVSFGRPEYWAGAAIVRARHLYGENARVSLLPASKLNSDMSALSAFRMAHVMASHSYQDLNDKDFAAVKKIFTHIGRNPNGTIFGNFVSDAVNAQKNADAYIDYIKHVCTSAEDHMQSHEFEIHMEPQDVFSTKEYGSGYVPLMYFTGERTSEFRRARANGSRFISVYPYASYVPKNLDGSPVMGDAAPASYSGYVFTKREHRGSDTDAAANNKNTNPYVSGTMVTADMCRSMTETFDAYIDPEKTAAAGVSLARIQHAVGDTGIQDLSVFIRGDGSVDGDAVLKVLVDDMNVIKASAKTSFQTEASTQMLRRVFERFGDAWTGGPDENGERLPLDAAVWMFANNGRHGRDMSEFRTNLSNELEKHLVRELRSVNGEDVDSFEASKHIFRRYISEFVNLTDDTVQGLSRDELSDVHSLDGTDFAAAAEKLAQAVSDSGDSTVDEALRELYGCGSQETGVYADPNVAQTFILKANTLRNASTRMYSGDYDDLLSLLSYSDRAAYEPNPGRRASDVMRGLDTAGTYAAVQLFSSDEFNILAAADAQLDGDDVDDERLMSDGTDDPGAAADSMTDQKAWFDATFSRIGGPDDKTLEWVERSDFDMSFDPRTGQFPQDTVEHAVWTATHPLATAAMRRVGEAMFRGEQDYDPSRVGITPQGVIYYRDANGTPLIKIGPVKDEVGYVRPCVMDAVDGEDSVEVDRPMLDENGWPVRDAQGMALTEKANMTVCEGVILDENGRLMNPVIFGALDPGDGAVPNRMYGISMKLRNYDGYGHSDFTKRMSFSTYHMNVMENLDRQLALYEASRATDMERMASARSTMYASVSGNSLRKAYRTNTMIMLDKPMCRAAHAYLTEDLGAFQDDNELDHGRIAANLLAAQAIELRGRCVLSKTTEDQNVGLFNQARHLQQARADRVTGDMDRKSLLRTDCFGARAMIFQENPYFDPVSTGTAKTVGTVAYLSDACRVSALDGSVMLDPKASGEARARMISLGVTDVDHGGLDARFVRYPGGQAVDRMQLSANGFRKSVSYASGLRFAMVNLGYNMEDGYIVAKRAANSLGHFNEDGRFVPLARWDKIGDTQSGNKGVVAKIVNTDITTEDGFMADFTYRYLQNYGFNHRSNSNHATAGKVDEAVAEWVRSKSADPDETLESYVRGLAMQDGTTVGDAIERLRAVQLEQAGGIKGRQSIAKEHRMIALITEEAEIRQSIRDAMAETCTDIGYWLLASDAEPFKGAYGTDHASWQLFNDNPGLDMAVTNVCVCTRSNPSILMHIGEALEHDNAYLAEHEGEPGFDRDAWIAGHSGSGLVTRNPDGSKSVTLGACGVTPVYVDCHYADDKNKDYTEDSRKGGRGWGMQEAYALLAKHSVKSLVPYVTANDPVLPKQMTKLNRRAMMNGFALDLDDSDIKCRRLTELFNDASLDLSSDDGITKGCSAKPGHVFIDMDALADRLISKIPDGVSQQDVDAALSKIGSDRDFTKFMALLHGTEAGEMSSAKTDEGLRSMFITLAGQYGGAFLLESEAGGATMPAVDIGLTYYDEEERAMKPQMVNLGVIIDDRSAVPLFLSNREMHNSEGDVMSSPSEDRLQFRIFKSELGTALAGRLSERDRADGRPYATEEACMTVARECREATSKGYKAVQNEKSLSLEGMNFWLKKHLFRMTFPNSLTCVWHGDSSLEIDECGISFEKAKSLRLLTPKKGLTPEELAKIPDTYEFMHERYEPLTDDDFVMVNRSPGQTTGCIRALRAKITGPDGGGITIHPALATIFDGDFDGDTVGVINPRTPEGMDGADPEYVTLRNRAVAELRGRMSMKANMVHKANFTSLDLPDGTKAEYLHPLFIAGNADLAVAMHNMSAENPDGTPACGYDVHRELDSVTAMANMTEQLRQCVYDFENSADNKIGFDDAKKIAGIRLGMIEQTMKFFTDRPGTALDSENAKAWDAIRSDLAPMVESARTDLAAGKPVQADLRALSGIEERTFHRLADTYRDMAGYMSEPPLMTHGDTALDIMFNIVNDANISKKGKAPQLNALLQFSGMHKDCEQYHGSAEGLLTVDKLSDGKFHLLAQHPDENGELKAMALEKRGDGYVLTHNGKDYGPYEAKFGMDHRRAVSDIVPTPFANPVMANIIAQSDKADATGIGGSMAQKMQKILAPMGYGELALRISGPLVQQYLDSKQNVRNCDKNLKIGKTILNKVAAGVRINELSDEHYANGNAVHHQVYNGQYTIGERGLTAKEYVSQMDNFLQVMRQPGLSPLDRAQFEAVMKKYEEPGKGPDKGMPTVGNPIKKADSNYDMVYAAIYSSDDRSAFARHLVHLADTKRGLYSGSAIFEGHVDNARLRDGAAKLAKLPDLGVRIDDIVDRTRVEAAVSGKEASLEQALKSSGVDSIRSSERPADTKPTLKASMQDRLTAIRERYNNEAEKAGPTDTLGDDW